MAKTKSGSGIKALYEKHRGAERSNPPDGKYVVQFRSIKFDETKGKEKAFLTGVISRGEMKGKPVMKSYWLHDREIKNGERKGEVLSGEDESIRMMEDFATLGIDTEAVDYDEIPDTLRSEKPSASVTIKNNGDFYNVRINEAIEDEDGDDEDDDEGVEEEEEEEEPQPKPTKRGKGKPAPEPEEEEEQEEEDDEEEDDEEEDDEEEDDEEEEEEEESPEPVKGGTCLAKPKGMKKQSVFKVKAVNKKAQTCDLVHEATGKEYKGIAWSDIEMDDDE